VGRGKTLGQVGLASSTKTLCRLQSRRGGQHLSMAGGSSGTPPRVVREDTELRAAMRSCCSRTIAAWRNWLRPGPRTEQICPLHTAQR
jgi:hypothetical protein